MAGEAPTLASKRVIISSIVRGTGSVSEFNVRRLNHQWLYQPIVIGMIANPVPDDAIFPHYRQGAIIETDPS